MFSKTPELYDQIYGSFKDYAAECARIAAVCASVRPPRSGSSTSLAGLVNMLATRRS